MMFLKNWFVSVPPLACLLYVSGYIHGGGLFQAVEIQKFVDSLTLEMYVVQ